MKHISADEYDFTYPIKPVTWMPAGTRWPWLPCITGHCQMGPPELIETADGIETSLTMTIVGEVHRGRIGLRRWAKHHARRRPQ